MNYRDLRNETAEAVDRIKGRPNGAPLTDSERDAVAHAETWLENSLTITEPMHDEMLRIADKYNSADDDDETAHELNACGGDCPSCQAERAEYREANAPAL